MYSIKRLPPPAFLYLLCVQVWPEQLRDFGGVGHAVELRPLRWRVVHLLHLLPACWGHPSLGGAPLLVSGFPLRPLQVRSGQTSYNYDSLSSEF